MAHTRWSDIREERIERIGREKFEAAKERMLAAAQGWRLAEIRRRRGSLRLRWLSGWGLAKAGLARSRPGRLRHATCWTVMSKHWAVG